MANYHKEFAQDAAYQSHTSRVNREKPAFSMGKISASPCPIVNPFHGIL